MSALPESIICVLFATERWKLAFMNWKCRGKNRRAITQQILRRAYIFYRSLQSLKANAASFHTFQIIIF